MSSSEVRRIHIEAWQTSGVSQAAYCREHGLNTKTFAIGLATINQISPGFVIKDTSTTPATNAAIPSTAVPTHGRPRPRRHIVFAGIGIGLIVTGTNAGDRTT